MTGQSFPTGFGCQRQEVSFSEGKHPEFPGFFSLLCLLFLPSGRLSLSVGSKSPSPPNHSAPSPVSHPSLLSPALPSTNNSLGFSALESLGNKKISGFPAAVNQEFLWPQCLVVCSPDYKQCQGPLPSLETKYGQRASEWASEAQILPGS